MTVRTEDIEKLDPEVQAWILAQAEGRLAEHEKATAAQEARAVVALTTCVTLAALAGLVGATALSIHNDTTVELVAALLALTGFSASSVLFLSSLRSGRFRQTGAAPAETLPRGSGETSLPQLRGRRLVELEKCIAENEAMMEERRRWANWGLWTLVATPVFALLCGWLAAS